MSLSGRLGRVRAAQARVVAQRAALAEPAAALLARGKRHPLGVLAAAAGLGFALGSLGLRPLRVPGLGSLLRGGLAEVVAQAARLFAGAPTDTGAPADDAAE